MKLTLFFLFLIPFFWTTAPAFSYSTCDLDCHPQYGKIMKEDYPVNSQGWDGNYDRVLSLHNLTMSDVVSVEERTLYLTGRYETEHLIRGEHIFVPHMLDNEEVIELTFTLKNGQQIINALLPICENIFPPGTPVIK